MKILLIESDIALAKELSTAIEARGVEVRVTSDGKDGVDLAKVDRPDLIVLCVELPKMSGYSVCNKLKKDDQLKSIPLVIISAEATQETFEQHKKLKTRAEGYLIKPFEPAALLSTIGGLIELPPEPTIVSSDEVVSLDEVELEVGGPPITPPSLSIPPQVPAEDDDLRLLDEAFESLASEEAKSGDEGIVAPEEAPIIGQPPGRDALSQEMDKLGDEADAALAALNADETTDVDLGRSALLHDSGGISASVRDGIAAMDLDPTLDETAPEIAAKNSEIERLQGRISDLLDEVARANEALEHRNGEAADAAARLRLLEANLDERRAGAGRIDDQLRKTAEEQTRAAQATAERAELALRAAAEETRKAEERARALENETKAQLQRAEREEAARKAADSTANASAERARAAEERVRAAEGRARAAEENLHLAEGRVHSAEELAHSAEARAGTAEARTIAAEARADTAEQESATLGLRLAEAEQAISLKAAEAEQARERAEGLGRELDASQASVAAHLGELAGLRAQLENLRAEIADTRSAAEGTKAESDRKLAEARKRINELEAQNAKHEERVVKAYQKIKADEKIREKTRKAVAIALQLLEDRALGTTPTEVQPRRE
jgi:CheY-like chemotaxis protein